MTVEGDHGYDNRPTQYSDGNRDRVSTTSSSSASNGYATDEKVIDTATESAGGGEHHTVSPAPMRSPTSKMADVGRHRSTGNLLDAKKKGKTFVHAHQHMSASTASSPSAVVAHGGQRSRSHNSIRPVSIASFPSSNTTILGVSRKVYKFDNRCRSLHTRCTRARRDREVTLVRDDQQPAHGH